MDEVQTHRRGLAGPLFLIAIGVGVLLGNLGILPQDFWEAVGRYWPVILIVLGLDGLYKRENSIGSILTVGLGIVFLLSNLGYISLDIWTIILRYWPLLIIAWGLDVLLSSGRLGALWRAFVGVAILIVMIAGIIWFSRLSSPGGQFTQSQQISQSVVDAKQVNLNVTAAVANIKLNPGTADSPTIQGRISHARSETIKTTYRMDNGVAYYTINNEGVTFLPGSGNDLYELWDLSYPFNSSSELKINLVIGECNANLTGAQVQKLSINNVIGRNIVHLPASGELSGDLSNVIGETNLVVPQGASVRIQFDSGLNNASFPDNYVREGDFLYSPEANSTGQWSDIKINQVVGKITVTEQP